MVCAAGSCPLWVELRAVVGGGVEVVVGVEPHTHGANREIGTKYWSLLTPRERVKLKDLKKANPALTTMEAKTLVNEWRTAAKVPLLRHVKPIRDLWQHLQGKVRRTQSLSAPPSTASLSAPPPASLP